MEKMIRQMEEIKHVLPKAKRCRVMGEAGCNSSRIYINNHANDVNPEITTTLTFADFKAICELDFVKGIYVDGDIFNKIKQVIPYEEKNRMRAENANQDLIINQDVKRYSSIVLKKEDLEVICECKFVSNMVVTNDTIVVLTK